MRQNFYTDLQKNPASFLWAECLRVWSQTAWASSSALPLTVWPGADFLMSVFSTIKWKSLKVSTQGQNQVWRSYCLQSGESLAKTYDYMGLNEILHMKHPTCSECSMNLTITNISETKFHKRANGVSPFTLSQTIRAKKTGSFETNCWGWWGRWNIYLHSKLPWVEMSKNMHTQESTCYQKGFYGFL